MNLDHEGSLATKLRRLYMDLRELHAQNNVLYISTLNQIAEMELHAGTNNCIGIPSLEGQIGTELKVFRKEYRDFKELIFDPLTASFVDYITLDFEATILEYRYAG